MPPTLVDMTAKPKKIIFDDDGEVVEETKSKSKKKQKTASSKQDTTSIDNHEGEEDFFANGMKNKNKSEENVDQKKWFFVYPQYPISGEVLDMKEKEQAELFNICKSSYEAELPQFLKKNPSDSRWLQTALYKGTAKDRANAGALLVTSNPMGNLQALETLIGYTKMSNKSSSEVIAILTDLLIEVLLPAHRKLLSVQMRGSDWKSVKKDEGLSTEQRRKIFAYWYYENELKDFFFEFLKNLQQCLQNGQETNKYSAIIAASRLLSYAPEKEQMLLTMLINKLGDPSSKVASKALHHLSEVGYKHPNMCGVITAETEKLLFRNNISDRAQHFALCFLSQIAPTGRPEVCTKLVNICFALFKVLVKKGAVNNRTMQAILRCLQKAIIEAQPPTGSTEIMTKDMQDTVYRLVHLADIRISIQTLSLLLQLVTITTEKSDRFYNALYKKMLDMELTRVGNKTAAEFLHILHRAVHIDTNLSRAQAFIKRLLQMALNMPAAMAAGSLIVIHKLLKAKSELTRVHTDQILPGNAVAPDDEELTKFDSDGEEKYEDIFSDTENKETEVVDEGHSKEAKVESSWHHAKIKKEIPPTTVKTSCINPTKYDPYHRVPAFAGAQFAFHTELLFLIQHYHPTVQVFAANILQRKKIDYYGDPLRDFNLSHFLERFAFKNPKKLETNKAEIPFIHNKQYVAYGARGKPVKSLTKSTCTEDEMFIFNYLEKKRETAVVKSKDDENDMVGDVDDDEFEQYLDGFFSKKDATGDDDEGELDFLKEIEGESIGQDKKKKKKEPTKKKEDEDEDMDDIDDDWGDDDAENDGSIQEDNSEDDYGSIDDEDDDGSISLEDDQSGDDISEPESDNDSDEDLKPPKSKKSKQQMAEKNFSKTLKHSSDMSTLFAAADDFAELLEETGKNKGQGTAGAVFNTDKSSDKQMRWEENRRSNSKNYTSKGKRFTGGGSKKFGKKRKS